MKRKNIILSIIGISVVIALSSCKEEYNKITFNDLPATSQEFLNTHFPNEVLSYIMEDKEMFDKTYEVHFADGDNVDFDADGLWDNVDCHNDMVPETILDAKILDYINLNHQGTYVVEIDKNRNNYDVELSNGLELVFDSDFDFKRYDD